MKLMARILVLALLHSSAADCWRCSATPFRSATTSRKAIARSSPASSRKASATRAAAASLTSACLRSATAGAKARPPILAPRRSGFSADWSIRILATTGRRSSIAACARGPRTGHTPTGTSPKACSA